MEAHIYFVCGLSVPKGASVYFYKTTHSSWHYVDDSINRTSIKGWWRVVTIDGTGWVSSQYITLV